MGSDIVRFAMENAVIKMDDHNLNSLKLIDALSPSQRNLWKKLEEIKGVANKIAFARHMTSNVRPDSFTSLALRGKLNEEYFIKDILWVRPKIMWKPLEGKKFRIELSFSFDNKMEGSREFMFYWLNNDKLDGISTSIKNGFILDMNMSYFSDYRLYPNRPEVQGLVVQSSI